MSRKKVFLLCLLCILALPFLSGAPTQVWAAESEWAQALRSPLVIDGKPDRVWSGRTALFNRTADESFPCSVRMAAGYHGDDLCLAAVVHQATGSGETADGLTGLRFETYLDPTAAGEDVYGFSFVEEGTREEFFRGDPSWSGAWESASGRSPTGRSVFLEAVIPMEGLRPNSEAPTTALSLSLRVLGKGWSVPVEWGRAPSYGDRETNLAGLLLFPGFRQEFQRAVEGFARKADEERGRLVTSGMRTLDDEQVKQTADLMYRIQRLRQEVASDDERHEAEWGRLWRSFRDLESRWKNLSRDLDSYIIEAAAAGGEKPDRTPRGKRRDDEPISSIVPKPIPWRRPSALGTLRVLVLAPYEAAWEISEMKARADVDVEYVALDSPKRFAPTGWSDHRPWTAPRSKQLSGRIVGLLEEEQWDAVLIGNFRWECLPAEVRLAILKETAVGGGLLGIGLAVSGKDAFAARLKGDRAGASEFLRFPEPTIGRRLPEVESMEFGQGRILCVNWGRQEVFRALTPDDWKKDDEAWAASYESAISVLCRGLTWVSGHSPAIRVVSAVGWEAPGGEIRIGFDAPLGKRHMVRWRVRSGGKIIAEGPPADLEEGTVQTRIAVPAFIPGSYQADVFLVERRGVVDWLTTPFVVQK